MKLHPRYRPELVAASDPTRTHLTEAHVDVAEKTISATDGHGLVQVPVDVDPSDVTGYLPRAAMSHARSADGVRARRSLVGGPNGPFYRRRRTQDAFPPVATLVKEGHAIDAHGTVSLSVDVELLSRLARAIGAGYSSRKKRRLPPLVTLTFKPGQPGEDMIDPITVRANGPAHEDNPAIAILMPARFR